MDERDETEYERGEREARELKYKRERGRKPSLSMLKGSDLAPLLWIAFFTIACVLLLYLGSAMDG
ncbi:hypothetical protein ACIBAC_42745 [Streptomyces sp. NPDC051362]|uniref:hypothetical protein n=1 Tax=Streptomyces sp. NPDC051362 TaxID=3365651 RepID=UPI0037AC00B8